MWRGAVAVVALVGGGIMPPSCKDLGETSRGFLCRFRERESGSNEVLTHRLSVLRILAVCVDGAAGMIVKVMIVASLVSYC